jgi:hypothetical protein
MRILSIDVETLGAVDIKSAGGYRYAETCTILLFGYAYDDDPVQVVDMARGEEIPRSVLSDLTNPDVLKVAYNAQFERTVLTHYCRKHGLIGADEWLDARQWLCTMVLGLTMGLPGNLAWAAPWALDRPAHTPGSGSQLTPQGGWSPLVPCPGQASTETAGQPSGNYSIIPCLSEPKEASPDPALLLQELIRVRGPSCGVYSTMDGK